SGSSAKPTSTEDFERFLDRSYLPHVRQTLKHATSKTYCVLFKLLRPHLGSVELPEMDSPTANRILKTLAAAKPGLVHNTFVKAKRFLSSAWKYAKSEGLDRKRFAFTRSEEHTSELQSRGHVVCR